jgi:transposase-like protein
MEIVSDVRARMQQALWNSGHDLARRCLQRWCQLVMEAERDAFLACRRHERSSARRGYRNGYEPRRLGSKHGLLRLRVPRTRGTERPFRTLLFDLYERRAPVIERTVEAWVAAGCSTRKVTQQMIETFGQIISPTTVSAIVARIDQEMAAWRRRPLTRSYRVLWLDAKHGKLRKPPRKGRRRGRKQKGVMLVAWGLTHDGREELVDFQAVAGEERYEVWEPFLRRLWQRGVKSWNPWGERLELVVTDGQAGLEAAVDMVFPTTPKQRCVFHKLKNLPAHLRDRGHREAIRASASAVLKGVQTAPEAWARLDAWSARWRDLEPEAVAWLRAGFERMLTYLTVTPALRTRVRTTNPAERFIKEIEAATGHVPVWENPQSWQRHLWILWKDLKRRGYRPTRTRSEFTRNT